MVVTAHRVATGIGVDVLKHGGNAVDAAVAVGYALAVVYPNAGNIGGGGFMTIRLADGRRTFIDFREAAPLAATRDMFLDDSGAVKPRASLVGHLAVAVPGTVAGLEYARGKYGQLDRALLMAPAIALADRGFTLDAEDARSLARPAADFRNDPASAAIFLDDGKPFAAGALFRQKDLARTLRRISSEGADGFYRGRTAQALVAASRAGGGILSLEDLARYEPRERPPLECDYRGYRIVSAPPPSSGGATVCEILGVLEGYPLKELGALSAKTLHYEIEAMRRAFVDRNNALGDPDFVENPVARLLDKAYAARLRDSIDPARATPSAALSSGAAPREGSNTTHYSIIDAEGNAVSVTYTLNESFGARVTAAGTGVLLNGEMDDFTVKRGTANLFGLVQGEQNAIAPGKRPLSSMSPTIVLRADGKPLMLLGSPGGSRIISAVVQVLVNVIDHGMDIDEAVQAPRIHQQWLPEETLLEKGAIPAGAREALEAMGHRFQERGPLTQVEAILVGAPRIGGEPVEGARFYGVHDRRGKRGLAAGF